MTVALCLIALMLLASCGSDNGSGGSNAPIRVVVTPVASPTSTPAAAPTAPPVTYRVKAGDTLSGIAALFGVTVDDIVRSNNIADPNSLAEGQVLTIPGRSPTPLPSPPPAVTGTPGTPRPITSTITITTTATPILPPPDVTPPQGPTAVQP